VHKKVEVEVSARHIHLSKSDYDFLFGAETPYKKIKELSQKEEFATDKMVKIVGPEGEVRARFLSPFRKKTQVELSLTDCLVIGINAPYEINVFDGAAEIIISGPQGEIERRAAIVARRHLHCNPKEAREIGLRDGQKLLVKIKTDRGSLIYSGVEVKIASNYQLRVHLDTDEGNAAGIKGRCFGYLIDDWRE